MNWDTVLVKQFSPQRGHRSHQYIRGTDVSSTTNLIAVVDVTICQSVRSRVRGHAQLAQHAGFGRTGAIIRSLPRIVLMTSLKEGLLILRVNRSPFRRTANSEGEHEGTKPGQTFSLRCFSFTFAVLETQFYNTIRCPKSAACTEFGSHT